MISFNQYNESINDKGILKAIFVIGLPGAGKSYTISHLNGIVSPKIVNTDKAVEFLGKKNHTVIDSSNFSEFADKSNKMTKDMLESYIDSMLPIFVDGTSNNISRILARVGILESLGYDVGVVFVKASLETSIRRAEERGKRIGRIVDKEFIEYVYKQNEENASYLASKVPFFKVVENNNDGLDNVAMMRAFKAVQAFYQKPQANPVGVRMINKMKSDGLKYLVPGLLSKEELQHKIAAWYDH